MVLNLRFALRGFLLLASTTAVSLIPANAAPVCVAGTAATFVALGLGGCQEGNLLFNNFSYISSANPAALAIPATAVAVVPIPTLFNEGFGFQISSGFAATGTGTFVDSVLQYAISTVDGRSSLTDLSLNSNGTATGNGLAGVSENYCVGATSTVGCAALRNIFVQTPGTLSAGATYGPVSRLAVSKDINVNSGAGGTATISLVTNQFSNGGGPNGPGGAVPEPATVTMFGFGLGAVAFGVIKKRRSTLN